MNLRLFILLIKCVLYLCYFHTVKSVPLANNKSSIQLKTNSNDDIPYIVTLITCASNWYAPFLSHNFVQVDFIPRCTGAQIDPQWIISAASCLFNKELQLFELWAIVGGPRQNEQGFLNETKRTPEFQSRYMRKIELALYHPGYTKKNKSYHDLALLRLSKMTYQSEYAKLPNDDDNIEFRKNSGANFYIYAYADRRDRAYQYIHIRNNYWCSRMLNLRLRDGYIVQYFDESIQFCGYPFHDIIYINDFGASLFMPIYNKNNVKTDVIVGVLSWTSMLDSRSYAFPLVFVDVYIYNQWITKVVELFRM